MTTQPPPEAKLLDKFPDGISALHYLPTSSSSNNDGKKLLTSTSWDGAVRVHDTTWSEGSSATSPLVLTHNMESGPLLSLAVTAGSSSSEAATATTTATTIVTGGLDGSIKSFDIATSTVRSIGFHDIGNSNGSSASEETKTNISNACSCLSTISNDDTSSNVVASASWNKQLCVWDLRQQNSNTPSAQVLLPGKAFSMDVDESRNRILVATSGRRTCVYDLRMLKEEETTTFKLDAVLERESSLKFQTRCIRLFPDGHGFCLGSIEGRVGVEFLDALADERMRSVAEKSKKYAFKCHRDSNSGLVYPVNAIDFHPKHRQTFATGGCDGTVVLWDGQNKKKLTALPAFPTSISAMAFSPDGTELAIASSYTHEEGDREQHPQDELYIRQILDTEATPKTATNGK
jgi:cell cycle arrest protein BUB3